MAMPKKKGKSKLHKQYALLQNAHNGYLAAVGRTNNRLYELLGDVFAFGQTCFKNSSEYD